MKKGTRTLLFVLAVAVTPGCGQSQIHPSKEPYLDWETWPVTTPADISFGDRFEPFRAEWSRVYRNMNGDIRQDRVIVVAEEVAWYGRPAISVTYHDSGNLEAAESNARTATVYLDRDNLSLLRATAPKTGTPEDYVTVSVGDGTVTRTAVTTATGETEVGRASAEGPVFGGFNLEFLIWAAVLGSQDHAVLFLYNPGIDDFAPSIVRRVGSEDVTLPGGQTVTALVVERPIAQPDNGRHHHFRVLDRPPYLVSRELVDLDTGETSFAMELLSWQSLGS